jgi:UDP-N-acetyl-D-glucosamine dehydrogenase
MRESPALDVIHLLQQKGGDVRYHDPFVPSFRHEDWAMTSISDLMAEVSAADAVVIVTNHRTYDVKAILDAVSVRAGGLLVDLRNATGALGKNHPNVVKL